MERKCNCIVTQGLKNEKGAWCTECGVKVLEVETNTCGYCHFFKSDLKGGVCSEKLMSVTPGMNVTYNILEGTCFKSKKAGNKQN